MLAFRLCRPQLLPALPSVCGSSLTLASVLCNLSHSSSHPPLIAVPSVAPPERPLHSALSGPRRGHGINLFARAMATASSVVPEVKGHVTANGVAVITLDRPKALNAMNLDMDRAFLALLDEWADSAAVKAVLVEGSTPRAFCAGMDIKSTAATIREDKSTPYVPQVFSAEYRLICRIARYPKPYISLMDGVTMGFGIGLSGHGSVRIVTEKTTLAMPENAIGLFPDVGFAHLAARMPGGGALGAYLALTGARVSSPEDVLFAGIATHSVPAAQVAQLREALLAADFSSHLDPSATIAHVLSSFPPAPASSSPPRLQALLPAIEAAFHRSSCPTVPLVLAQLQAQAASSDEQVAAYAREALQACASGAPFSLALCLRHFHAVATAVASAEHALAEGIRAVAPPDGLDLTTIEGVMTSEYRIALRSSTRPDFLEGVRAVLVDKDKNPKWSPSSVEAVDPIELDCAFAPLLEGDELAV